MLGSGGFIGGAIVAQARRRGRRGRRARPQGTRSARRRRRGAARRAAARGRRACRRLGARALQDARHDAREYPHDGVGLRRRWRKRPVAHLVYISSDAVYADGPLPLTEASPAAPTSLHGAMHLAREQMLLARSRHDAARHPAADARLRRRRSAQRLRTQPIPPPGQSRRGHRPVRRRRGTPRSRRCRRHCRDCPPRARRTARPACSISRPARSRASAPWPTRRSRCRRARSTIKGSPRNGPMPHNGYRPFDPAATLKAFPGFRYTADRCRTGARATPGIRLMPHVDLLRALPKTKRNIQKRAEAKDPAVIAIAKQYGEMYWDGPREYGYGGYRDDGRWHPVARDIIAHFGLKAGHARSRRRLRQGISGQGAADGMSRPGSLRPRHLALCADALLARGDRPPSSRHARRRLPFPDGSFDCVLSLNTIHNFPRPRAIIAMREIQRLSQRPRFRSG